MGTPLDGEGWQMRRFIRSLFGTITAGIQAALILNPLLVAQAVAQGSNEDGSPTVPGLKHLSIWTSPTPTPDNAFVAILMSAVRIAAYCEPVSLQPQFRTDITRYEAGFPGDVDLNVLAAATLPEALIEMSLTTASGDALPVITADGVSVEFDDTAIRIPGVWSLARQITGASLNVAGMTVGENTLEIRVSSADGDAFRSYVFQLNRLSLDPDADGDPVCPEPQLDALLDAVAEMESGIAQ